MNQAACTLFDSAVGRCGIAWRGDRVSAFALPGAGDAGTLAQLRRRHPATEGSATPTIVPWIQAVQRLLEGEPEDLRFIPLDLEQVPAFERRVYELLRAVGPGEVVTYGERARRAGAPGAARAVGAAMGRNPVPVIVPCHRVLAGSGRSGGFSAPGGVGTKFRLLQIEQARRSSAPMLFDELPLAVKSLT